MRTKTLRVLLHTYICMYGHSAPCPCQSISGWCFFEKSFLVSQNVHKAWPHISSHRRDKSKINNNERPMDGWSGRRTDGPTDQTTWKKLIQFNAVTQFFHHVFHLLFGFPIPSMPPPHLFRFLKGWQGPQSKKRKKNYFRRI